MIVRTVLRGLGASPGVAVGRALVVREAAASVAPPDVGAALAALAQAAAELNAAAADLRRRGLADEAEILETNCLMAEDPVLAAGVRAVGVPYLPGRRAAGGDRGARALARRAPRPAAGCARGRRPRAGTPRRAHRRPAPAARRPGRRHDSRRARAGPGRGCRARPRRGPDRCGRARGGLRDVARRDRRPLAGRADGGRPRRRADGDR